MFRFVLLALEFSTIFVVLPLLIYYRLIPNWPIPFLLLASLGAFLYVRHAAGFDATQLSSWGHISSRLLPLFFRDAILLVLLGIAVWFFAPQLLFSLLKRAPLLWAAIMVLYPVVSVYPQELLYRAFFFHRYQPLFGSGWVMLAASALAFGFVHIIFGNWLSVVLCVFGGFLFASTYHSSGSLLLTCIDHAIFGDFIFTIGLGQFFYHGSRL